MMMASQDKKILFLTHVGNIGGAEFKMMDIAEKLDFSNIKVVHFKSGALEKALKDKKINSEIIPMPKSLENFTKNDGLKALLKTIPASLSMIKKLAKEAKNHDVIVPVSQKAFLIASIAKPFHRKPIIWFMNDILSPNYFNKILIFLLVALSYMTSNRVVLNSQASLEAWKLARANTKNVHVIYPGIDIDKFEAASKDQEIISSFKKKYSPDNKPLVGIFGRISSWKGQNIFLEAIARIEGVNAVIVGDALFGEEDFKKQLMEQLKSLDIENRVSFTGHIDDVPHAMSACDIVAHCSTLPEPFGQVIAQASMAGAAVIATNAGGAKEIIEHNVTGQLTPMADVESLATAIQKYVDNPSWADELNKKAKVKVTNNFSKEKMVQQTADIILSVA